MAVPVVSQPERPERGAEAGQSDIGPRGPRANQRNRRVEAPAEANRRRQEKRSGEDQFSRKRFGAHDIEQDLLVFTHGWPEQRVNRGGLPDDFSADGDLAACGAGTDAGVGVAPLRATFEQDGRLTDGEAEGTRRQANACRKLEIDLCKSRGSLPRRGALDVKAELDGRRGPEPVRTEPDL
jgi:hypothetical protein